VQSAPKLTDSTVGGKEERRIPSFHRAHLKFIKKENIGKKGEKGGEKKSFQNEKTEKEEGEGCALIIISFGEAAT